MKITRFILSALFGCCLVLSAVACSDLSGDNSDFNFGDMPSDEPENPYDGQGYDRLPSSVRLATYNTHRCEGWTQNSAFEIIKVGKMWVKRKMRKNAAITLYFNML